MTPALEVVRIPEERGIAAMRDAMVEVGPRFDMPEGIAVQTQWVLVHLVLTQGRPPCRAVPAPYILIGALGLPLCVSGTPTPGHLDPASRMCAVP